MVVIEPRTFQLNQWARNLLQTAVNAIRRQGRSFDVCGEGAEPLFEYVLPDGKHVFEEVTAPKNSGPLGIIVLVDEQGQPIDESLQWP
jgi:hypothetical protein